MKKEALQFFAAGGEIGRALIAPPELSDDRFEALSQAFGDLIKDPDFLADAAARGIPLNPKNASSLQANVDRIFSAPSDVVAPWKGLGRASWRERVCQYV